MLGIDLKSAKRVLLLGAHCDDIEIGVGATVLRLLRDRPDLEINWVVFSGNDLRQKEAADAAEAFLRGCEKKTVTLHRFRDAHFPMHMDVIKAEFEKLKAFAPDLIFTHTSRDSHQDHRAVNELTWNTFRNHTILEYEITKYEGDLGRPTVYAPATGDDVAMKVRHLMECFPSQTSRQWYDEETFRGLMRIRGIECNSPTKYAEAFYCRKILI